MEGANFAFNMDFNNMNFAAGEFDKPLQGNTDNGFFFGDEGIDTTTTNSFSDQSFDAMNAGLFGVPATEPGFAMQQNLAMDNTMGSASAWNSQLDFAPTQSFGSAFQQPFGVGSKRPLQLDTQDFPQSKRHESVGNFASPFLPSASVTGSSWTANTPSSSVDIGLSDEAADVCAMWFSKYAVLPSDRHIDSLSQLTGESAPAIRNWFGQLLKQGMNGHDSAYKSQTSLSQQDQFFGDSTNQSQTGSLFPPVCSHDTTQSTSPPALRGGKKGCTPTNNPELLRRDPEKIYQCTRKCGKRYGRKCDWKRNEEEGYPSKSWICSLCISQGVEKVKPCFRKYHFSQHFRNIHPGLNCAEYEEASLVQSDTSFPRRCGFCSHRFKSRQDRIDHIADHFKKGKSMLEWNDDGDDSNDSDDMDDDDNDDGKPSGDEFFGGSSGSFGDPPAPQGPPGPQRDGSNNDGNSGPGYGPFSGYGAFQSFSELNSSEDNGQSSGLPSCANERSIIKRGVQDNDAALETPTCQQEQQQQKHIIGTQLCVDQQRVLAPPDPGEQYSSSKQRLLSASSPECNEPTQVDRNTVAGDAVPRALISGSDEMTLSNSESDNLSTLLSARKSQTETNDSGDSLLQTLKQSSRSELVPDIGILRRQFRANESRVPLLVENGQSQICEHDPGSSILRRLYRSHESRVPGLDENAQSGVLAGSSDADQVNTAIEKPSAKVDLLDHEFGRSVPNASTTKEWSQADILNKAIALQKITRDDFEPVESIATMNTADQSEQKDALESSLAYNIQVSCSDNQKPESVPDTEYRSSQTSAQDHALTTPPPRVPSLFEDSKCSQYRALGMTTVPEEIEQALQTSTIDKVQSSRLKLQDPALAIAQWREINAAGEGVNTQSHSFLSVKLLGAGGFSTVDEVLHRETQLRISRKTLKNREQSAMHELQKEVDVLKKLRHPHIIRFIGAYTKDDKVSILLSPVAETTLAVWMDTCYTEKPAGLAATVMKMFGCLVSSVRYLHEQRPVVKHMDIKPQNILVMHSNTEVPHVVLTDFGISSSDEMALDLGSKPVTRQYCAPEVPAGLSREQPSDIWSLGCVFLEMMAAALTQNNSDWLDFREEFSGRKGKYYWQDVPRLQDCLSTFADQAPGLKEQNALWAIKAMLNGEPSERPDAATLTMVFTPASCCLSWPNERASFPGPNEERETVDMLVRDDGNDCLAEVQVCNDADHKHDHETFARAKTWLDECSHGHEACRKPQTEAKTLPKRLLDIQPDNSSSVRVVDSTCLMSSPTKVDYVAISHTWGNGELTLSTDRLANNQTDIPREQLPAAVNDAFNAAKRIGFRYVWLDSLCVVQDSVEDKQRECANMASVYRNAAMTIVATNANEPLNVTPNTFADAQHLAKSAALDTTDKMKYEDPVADWNTPGFAWDTRAWALQERLLCGRLLHLTGEQMYWECNALKASETFPRGLPSLIWEKVHTKTTMFNVSPKSNMKFEQKEETASTA